MDVREKLVELMRNAHKKCKAKKTCHECEQYGNGADCVYLFMANDLISHGVTVQEWIPVTERMPENLGLYLVIETHWLDGSPVRKIAKWNTIDWFTADIKSKEITERVTHWMPLPQPPKGE